MSVDTFNWFRVYYFQKKCEVKHLTLKWAKNYVTKIKKKKK